MNGLSEWRKFYGSLGFVTIPLRPREKRPLRKGWKEGDPNQWTGASENANIGILTGAPSGGLVVLDFDTEDGPFNVLGLRPRELASRTMVVKTARGWHVYARSLDTPTTSPRPGLDIRGDGALVVAPPSVHPSGAFYRWLGDRFEVAPLASFTTAEMIAPVDVAERVPVLDIDMDLVEEWISAQWPALQAAWAKLKRPPAGESFDPSRADFAVARCLWEGGYSAEDVATILCALPGSRAQERGRGYALRTAIRARERPRA